MGGLIKVVFVDDHELFLKGIERLLVKEPDISIVGSYESGRSLLQDLPTLDIDLLLLDLQLQDIASEKLLRSIIAMRPGLPILYLTMMRGARIFKKLSNYPIGGYVLKDASLDELCGAIRKVAAGEKYFSEDIFLNKEVKANTVTIPKGQLADILSPREKEVLQLICKEHSSAEIAKILFVSTSTIDSHRKNMMFKLGVQNTVGLVKFAIKNGLVDD